MIKKFFLSFIVSLVAISAVFATVSQPVYANDPDVTPAATDDPEEDGGDCREFLGLQSWDCHVDIDGINSSEGLKTGVWTIAANVLIDLTIVAAYLVVGYVIYGGYLYTMSSGDPAKTAAGKKTLTHAFLGLAIVMLANVILNTIRIVLMGAGGSFADDCTSVECANPTNMVANIIQWSVGVVGLVSAIFVVYGGISYVSSAGDPGKLQKAKNTIMYALIGLIIVALAEIITAFVAKTINDANKSSYINTTIISKEVNEIKIN